MLKENVDAKNIFVETSVTNVAKSIENTLNVINAKAHTMDTRSIWIAWPVVALAEGVKVCSVIKKLEHVSVMRTLTERNVTNAKLDTMDFLIAKVTFLKSISRT